MKKIGNIIVLSLLILSSAFSQVTYKSFSSKRNVSIGDRLKITFEVVIGGSYGNISDIKFPKFKGFDIVAGPMKSSRSSYRISGSFSSLKSVSVKTVEFIYILSPTKIGELIIPKSQVVVGGDKYFTKPIYIDVSKGNGSNIITQNSSQNSNNLIDVRLEVSNENPFVGEPIIASYKVYFTNVNISRPVVKSSTSFDGFWSKDFNLGGSSSVDEVVVNGEKKLCFLFKKQLLIPQKLGSIHIKPLRVLISSNVSSGQYDFFGRPIYSAKEIVLETQNLTVNVKPLPTSKEEFSGGVGEFNFSVKYDKQKLEKGESLELDMQIKGSGNLNFIEFPEVNFPKNVEVYTPKIEKKIRLSENGYKGRVNKKYVIVPINGDKIIIPEMKFTFFSKKNKKYITKTFKSKEIEIIGGEKTPVEDENLEKTDFKAEKSFGLWKFMSLALLGVVVFLLFLVYRKSDKKNIVSKKKALNDKKYDYYLNISKNNLNDNDEFYNNIEKTIIEFSKEKLGLEKSAFSIENLTKKLLDKKVNSDIVNDFVGVIENINSQKYSPIKSISTKEIYDKINDFLNKKMKF